MRLNALRAHDARVLMGATRRGRERVGMDAVRDAASLLKFGEMRCELVREGGAFRGVFMLEVAVDVAAAAQCVADPSSPRGELRVGVFGLSQPQVMEGARGEGLVGGLEVVGLGDAPAGAAGVEELVRVVPRR